MVLKLDCQLCLCMDPNQHYLPIPMPLRIFVQRREHDREDDVDIVTDKVAEVLVVPEIKSSLGNLEVWARN